MNPDHQQDPDYILSKPFVNSFDWNSNDSLIDPVSRKLDQLDSWFSQRRSSDEGGTLT